MYTIDVDTGGTFTDGFFTRGKECRKVKVLTTPHDLTVCLAECIKEGAQQFGLAVEDFLANTDIVRYSTTVSVNTLITRTGSKIGLLISKGNKERVYAKDERDAEPIFSLISPDMIQKLMRKLTNKEQVKSPSMEREVLEKAISNRLEQDHRGEFETHTSMHHEKG